MGHILPANYPFVCGLPDHAFFLSAITDGKKRDKWIANQYINVTCNKNFMERKTIGFDFCIDYEKCPYLEITYIPNVILEETSTGLWRQLCSLIDNNYYLTFGLNENVIPNRQFYQCGKTTYHNHFMYGYDEKTVYLGCFNKVGKFIFDTLPVDTFLETLGIGGDRRIQTVKCLENKKYDLNEFFILCSLKDYLYSYDIPMEYSWPVQDQCSEKKAFGIEVYHYLADFFGGLFESQAEYGIDIDFRPLFMMAEQKKCMIKRMGMLEQKWGCSLQFYKNCYVAIEKQLNISQNCLIKYMFSRQKQLLEMIADKLMDCQHKEKDILKTFIELYEEKIINA